MSNGSQPYHEAIMVELHRLAVIGAGLLDGEEIKAIITPRALHHVTRPDPDHQYLAADYYDVEHVPFLRVKKLLMRIERLAVGCKVDGCIWLAVPSTDQVTLVLQNGCHHRYFRFGEMSMTAPPEMRRALDHGEIVTCPPSEDVATLAILAPLRDSLQDIVACVEFASSTDALAPDWS